MPTAASRTYQQKTLVPCPPVCLSYRKSTIGQASGGTGNRTSWPWRCRLLVGGPPASDARLVGRGDSLWLAPGEMAWLRYCGQRGNGWAVCRVPSASSGRPSLQQSVPIAMVGSALDTRHCAWPLPRCTHTGASPTGGVTKAALLVGPRGGVVI
jgi:hypothetical protein